MPACHLDRCFFSYDRFDRHPLFRPRFFCAYNGYQFNAHVCAVDLYASGSREVFFNFFLICFFGGIIVELIGTKTGYLFGNYAYGKVLGPAIEGVPLIIGINWFIVMYCSGTAIHTLMHKLAAGKNANELPLSGKLRTVALIIDGATLAVFFDWLMEPVAIKLGYWKWLGDGEIPFYNYLCWFVLSVLFLILFNRMSLYKNNKFAVHLLGIQAMFFLLLRTLL